MNLKTFRFWSRVIMGTSVLFSGLLVKAQDSGKAVVKADTMPYSEYRMMQGHRVAHSKWGELNIRPYTYFRYLNQNAIDKDYSVDASGAGRLPDPRQDIQLQKVSIYFSGWAFDPKFTYFLYVWTTNASQGQGAQVVVAGNLSYTFSKHFRLTGGITALPGTRSTEGNYPFWLSVDNRTIGDEYMRPSYTSGLLARGEIVPKLSYQVMVGNNMSTLGIDAGQLDNKLNTVAGGLVDLPTTGEYGMFNGSFGDYDQHKELATRVGVHYTRSTEDKQSQPNTDVFENVSLKVSDGTSIFSPNLLAPNMQIENARDQMFCVDAGAKLNGFALEGEYYWRKIDKFSIVNIAQAPLPDKTKFNDNGFQLLASAMIFPKKLQAYTTYSKIFGEYGNPDEFRLGVNFFPFKKTIGTRINAQGIFMNKSPVGGLAYPYSVGANGFIFNLDVEFNF